MLLSRVKSEAFYDRAVKVIPGGVNSPVRAFKAVGGAPVFMARGDGAYLFDVDGNRYLDCIGSWGPLILGHIHPRVKNAISRQLSLGTTFGAPTELEILLAEKIILNVPSIEMVRMVSSGTEATMSAIRVARGFTGRTKIVKFEGNYHGHFDALLAKAGSGIATLGLPDSAGVPASITQDTLTIPYNNIAAVKELFDKVGSEVACIIVEPVVGNSGCIAPQPG
ncbi:MAG: aminotransferase class III-fold pyridoxal phosphate-dependent enzyme, partial [Chthonomonadales bacterium]